MDTTTVLRRSKINVSTDSYDKAQLFRVRCDVSNRTTMLELYETVSKALESGLKSVAVSFTSDSYLFSEIIPHLLKINKLVQMHGARFFVIEHDPCLRSVLDQVGISRVVQVISSPAELPNCAGIN